jgi:hypothetical protein
MRWDESIQCFARSIESGPTTRRCSRTTASPCRGCTNGTPQSPFSQGHRLLHPGDYVEAIEQLANALLASNRNDEAWTCLNELWKNDGTERRHPVATPVRQPQALRLDRSGGEAIDPAGFEPGLRRADRQPLCHLVIPRRQCPSAAPAWQQTTRGTASRRACSMLPNPSWPPQRKSGKLTHGCGLPISRPITATTRSA